MSHQIFENQIKAIGFKIIDSTNFTFLSKSGLRFITYDYLIQTDNNILKVGFVEKNSKSKGKKLRTFPIVNYDVFFALYNKKLYFKYSSDCLNKPLINIYKNVNMVTSLTDYVISDENFWIRSNMDLKACLNNAISRFDFNVVFNLKNFKYKSAVGAIYKELKSYGNSPIAKISTSKDMIIINAYGKRIYVTYYEHLETQKYISQEYDYVAVIKPNINITFIDVSRLRLSKYKKSHFSIDKTTVENKKIGNTYQGLPEFFLNEKEGENPDKLYFDPPRKYRKWYPGPPRYSKFSKTSIKTTDEKLEPITVDTRLNPHRDIIPKKELTDILDDTYSKEYVVNTNNKKEGEVMENQEVTKKIVDDNSQIIKAFESGECSISPVDIALDIISKAEKLLAEGGIELLDFILPENLNCSCLGYNSQEPYIIIKNKNDFVLKLMVSFCTSDHINYRTIYNPSIFDGSMIYNYKRNEWTVWTNDNVINRRLNNKYKIPNYKMYNLNISSSYPQTYTVISKYFTEREYILNKINNAKPRYAVNVIGKLENYRYLHSIMKIYSLFKAANLKPSIPSSSRKNGGAEILIYDKENHEHSIYCTPEVPNRKFKNFISNYAGVAIMQDNPDRFFFRAVVKIPNNMIRIYNVREFFSMSTDKYLNNIGDFIYANNLEWFKNQKHVGLNAANRSEQTSNTITTQESKAPTKQQKLPLISKSKEVITQELQPTSTIDKTVKIKQEEINTTAVVGKPICLIDEKTKLLNFEIISNTCLNTPVEIEHQGLGDGSKNIIKKIKITVYH